MNGLQTSTQWKMLVDEYKRANTFPQVSSPYSSPRNLLSLVFTKSMTTTIKLPRSSLQCSILLAVLLTVQAYPSSPGIYRSTSVLRTSRFSPSSYHTAHHKLRQSTHNRLPQRSQHRQLPQRRPIQHLPAPYCSFPWKMLHHYNSERRRTHARLLTAKFECW